MSHAYSSAPLTRIPYGAEGLGTVRWPNTEDCALLVRVADLLILTHSHRPKRLASEHARIHSRHRVAVSQESRHDPFLTHAFRLRLHKLLSSVHGLTMTPLLRILEQLDSAAVASRACNPDGRHSGHTAPMCATGQNIKDAPGNHVSRDAERLSIL